MLEDSLKKRYIYKLITNLISAVISVLIQVLLPRGLGPKLYGDFSFITNFFQQIINFFDLWITPCFYIKFSQRQKEFGLIVFTFYFIGICFFAFFLSLLLIPSNSLFYIILLPGQVFYNILLAAVLSIFIWVTQVFSNISDAYGLTVKSEIGRMIQKLISLIIIFILFIFNYLDVANYFYSQYITVFLLILMFIWIIHRNKSTLMNSWIISINNIKRYFYEFFKFSYPLFTIGLIGLISGIFDRWLLQKYGGSIEQGFFGISNQVGMICFIFTSAMTPLIMREFSIASISNDINKISKLFHQNVPLLFAIAAFFSCFLFVQADKVAYIFGGKDFMNASLAVSIMCFYPVHQTYGQLNGSVFMATGRTELYSKIGIISMIIGVPITYFLIASESHMGIEAGASGLAIKMVLIQFVTVNVQLYFNTKYLKIKFWEYLIHQFIVLICFTTLSIFSLFIEKSLLNIIDNLILKFIISGFLYSIMVFILIAFKPNIFGLKHGDLNKLISPLLNKYRSKK